MAHRLIRTGVTIDRFVSSSAKRARQTAGYFVHAYGRKEKEIVLLPELYHASLQTFKAVVAGLDDNDNNVALFSHNPGITLFVNSLTNTRVDNMPTCGVFAVRSADAANWSGFFTSGPEFWFFDYPKSGYA
jgi:phosphohistidine phosphatase